MLFVRVLLALSVLLFTAHSQGMMCQSFVESETFSARATRWVQNPGLSWKGQEFPQGSRVDYYVKSKDSPRPQGTSGILMGSYRDNKSGVSYLVFDLGNQQIRFVAKSSLTAVKLSTATLKPSEPMNQLRSKVIDLGRSFYEALLDNLSLANHVVLPAALITYGLMQAKPVFDFIVLFSQPLMIGGIFLHFSGVFTVKDGIRGTGILLRNAPSDLLRIGRGLTQGVRIVFNLPFQFSSSVDALFSSSLAAFVRLADFQGRINGSNLVSKDGTTLMTRGNLRLYVTRSSKEERRATHFQERAEAFFEGEFHLAKTHLSALGFKALESLPISIHLIESPLGSITTRGPRLSYSRTWASQIYITPVRLNTWEGVNTGNPRFAQGPWKGDPGDFAINTPSDRKAESLPSSMFAPGSLIRYLVEVAVRDRYPHLELDPFIKTAIVDYLTLSALESRTGEIGTRWVNRDLPLRESLRRSKYEAGEEHLNVNTLGQLTGQPQLDSQVITRLLWDFRISSEEIGYVDRLLIDYLDVGFLDFKTPDSIIPETPYSRASLRTRHNELAYTLVRGLYRHLETRVGRGRDVPDALKDLKAAAEAAGITVSLLNQK